MVGGGNIGVITVRQIAEGTFDHVLITNLIIDNRITSSNKGIGYLYPQYLEANQTNSRYKYILSMNYSYVLLHSPNYRKRFIEFLRNDYPRVFPINSKQLFKWLSSLVSQLIYLHLLKSPLLNDTSVSYPVPGDRLVEKGFLKFPPYSPCDNRGDRGRVHINKDLHFEGVPLEAWNFHIGGYRMLEKWLKDRRGRALSADDREHHRKVVKAIVETIRVMKEIDETIPGWLLP